MKPFPAPLLQAFVLYQGWRHTTALGWQTPRRIQVLCGWLGITTPEQHWSHHQKVTQAFGDIFTCFDQPAKAWFCYLRRLRWYGRSLWMSPVR